MVYEFPEITSDAAGLLRRDDAPSHSFPWYGIAGIVLLVLGVTSTVALSITRAIRRRRKAAESRDTPVPNNFSIVGGFSSILDSRRSSKAPSVYKPTNEYGQYRAPPLPKPAPTHNRNTSMQEVSLV